jgi:hypothetical protein
VIDPLNCIADGQNFFLPAIKLAFEKMIIQLITDIAGIKLFRD